MGGCAGAETQSASSDGCDGLREEKVEQKYAASAHCVESVHGFEVPGSSSCRRTRVRLDYRNSVLQASSEGDSGQANVSTRSQGPGVLLRRNGHVSPIVLGVCLALWPMRKLSNVDAYTMEQVRRADYATNCGLGFAGLHCSEVITCEELDYCSGHGICQRGGYCMCDIGWEGATCKQSYCPSGCSGHGSCAATGGCVCDAGFTGMICDSVICLGGGNCTGHGACLHGGVCSCEKGYLGAACDVIDVVQKCSNHGYPDDHGNCRCDLWFTGPDCSLALCMNNCSDHGACDSRTGMCWCDPGWTAGDCSKKLCYNNCTGHGTCFEGLCTCQDGYSGDDCSIFPCLNSCSGHGACYNGTCACDRLYTGKDCSIYEGYLIECPGNCTGRGTCMNATCFCDRGWAGVDCSGSVDCPGNCTGHGMCYNSTCSCDLGFSGLDCAMPYCLNNCSLHGACTLNGTCSCDPTWHGADCSLPDLTCGVGFHGNCSGHGTCMDSAENQWWSGNSRLPDMWAWEEVSKHLARRDVERVGDTFLGKCDIDFYGIPTVVSSRATMAFAQGERVMQSNGVPEHFVINNGFPMCEVAWSISVTPHPRMAMGPCNYGWPMPRDAMCPTPYPLPRDSPIGYALNGVPIWGALLSDGSNAVEGSEPVPCYGHSSRSGMWHYHHPILGCGLAANQETLLGYAMDGFPIYGPFSGTKADVDAILDKCNGRALEDGSYRYHVRTIAQVDERMLYQDNSKDPRNPMGIAVHNNWNYVLGCFSGKPASSLGLRQVTAPLVSESDRWMTSHNYKADNTAISENSLASQLGLLARIGLCMCDTNWVGSDCRTMGCPNNCTGHGICVSNEKAASCSCDYMFEGNDCGRHMNNTCSIGCNGHGTCLWEDYLNATCLCDPAWGGRNCEEVVGPPCPYNCSGHGSCFNKTCSCDHMYDGPGCETPSAYALNINSTLCWQWIGNIFTNNSCGTRGTCFNGTCICDAGWSGINCTLPIVTNPIYIDCPNNCSFHGACSHVFDAVHVSYNGTCICDVGYDGPDCSIDWGSHQCDGNCSAHGTCVNKTCICDPGWDGYDCNNRWVSPYILCPMNCSDHGSCFNGTCTCDLGWHGSNCSLPDPCPGDCSGHGVCSLGNCTCDPEWAGDDCSHLSYCPGFLPELGVNCSGHGVCLGGNCSCELQWGGLDCSVPGCLNSCSNNGICRNGTCDCLVGFIGKDCSMGPYSGECPGQCSGHGACSIVESLKLPFGIADVYGDGILSGSIACACDEGWDGTDCMIRSCPNDCSGNGACAQNGTCFCYRNWGGEDCSTAWCPNACSNHGTCMGGQGCLCDVGYDGLDCGISACPNNCTGRGVCLASPGIEYDEQKPGLEAENGYISRINRTQSNCLCFYGWGGEDCSHITCPLNCSFPNGVCNNGTCICNTLQGYYGRNCSQTFGVVSLRTDGKGITPSYGIFEGRTLVTVKGTGFVNSDTMRCKFGTKLSLARIVVPNPPEVPFALCTSPGELAPATVMFQFSLDNREWTMPDSRIQFVYHGYGIVTGVRWPTGPESGGSKITFFGINFQFALGVQCKFNDYVVDGSFNVRWIPDPMDARKQQLEAYLMCTSPGLLALKLPESAGNSVVLSVSMNMGQNWMHYEYDYLYKYYGITRISPSFGPQQDQNTIIAVYGFNFFQGSSRRDLFPGFDYKYTCQFSLPWSEKPVVVESQSSSWVLVTAPPDGARFSCKVPPGLLGASGYTGPVKVGISLNPCIYDPADVDKQYGCISRLDYTADPITFWYVENTVNQLSLTLGPASGGTYVTITGNHFDRRDISVLPRDFTHPPILCKWDTVITQGTYDSPDQSVICRSPPCVHQSCLSIGLGFCPDCVAPVNLEVALNGQDFTESRVKFFYYKDPKVQSIYPSLGSILGGTPVTVRALGFHDPCINCSARADCATCGKLIKCKFQAFTRVEYTDGECIRTSEGVCDPTRIKCLSPGGGILRGSVVSLEPFYVAFSVSVNNQQFYPINIAEDNQPYNVYDPQCEPPGRTTGCAFLFKYYEDPIVYAVSPTAMAGSGGGRLTLTGINFLNQNELRCRYGTVFGPPACASGATGDFSSIRSPGLCTGAVLESPIFISQSMIICGTVSLESMTSTSGEKVSETSVGISFNGGNGQWDTVFLPDNSGNVKQDSVKVYWVLSIQPTLGFMTGGTKVTVTGVNLEVMGSGPSAEAAVRCSFGDKVIAPDGTRTPVPVDFVGGKIVCISPPSALTKGMSEVVFGICLLGSYCQYMGVSRQGDQANILIPEVNHFTKDSKFLYYEAPKLISLTPSLGPNQGNTFITIHGVGFFKSPLLACRFDLSFSSISTFVSSSTVICKTPPMITTGTYAGFAISLNGQQLSAGCAPGGLCSFYVYNEPTIEAVNPSVGVNTGRSVVVLTVENAVLNFFQLKCKFLAVDPMDKKRLELEGLSMETEASMSGSSVTCYTPSSQSTNLEPILRTPTPSRPLRGLTYVQLTWNGQQFGPAYPGNTDLQFKQQFQYHDAVESIVMMPSSGRTDQIQTVTLFGNNFVNSRSLRVKFGENLELCAIGALDCPDGVGFKRDAVTFISAQELRFQVPTNPTVAQKTVKVSNNGLALEYSSDQNTRSEYSHFGVGELCPKQCKGLAPTGTDGHGECGAIGSSVGCSCKLGYSGFACGIGPAVLLLEPSVGLTTGGFQVTVIGRNIWKENTATIGNTFKVMLDKRVIVDAFKASSCMISCENQLVFTVPTATDPNGPMRAAPTGMEVEITVNGKDYTLNRRLLRLVGPPSITSIVPNGSHYGGNVKVTVYGTGFIDSDQTKIRLGPQAGQLPCLQSPARCLQTVFKTSSQLIFETPPCLGACNFWAPLLVRLGLNGVDFINTTYFFRYLEDSILTTMVPRVGSLAGGTPVTIEATNMNYTSGFSCKFGEQMVLGSIEDGKMVCRSAPAPNGKNGSVPVRIALDGQTFDETPDCTLLSNTNRCFDYKLPLSVSRVYPTLGPVQGGTKITIFGSGFYSVDGVQGLCSFRHAQKGTFRTPLTFIDSGRYTCVSPTAQMDTYNFTFAANGADFEPSLFNFQFYLHPSLVAASGNTVEPRGSSLDGGTSVTISGSGFIDSGDGIRVRWCRRPDCGDLTIFLSNTAVFKKANEIVVKTHTYPHSEGRTWLSVSLNDGIDFSTSAADIFVWYRPPVLKEIQPPLGPRLGETAVVLIGEGLINIDGVAQCMFGDKKTYAIFDDSNAEGPPVLRCVSPPWPVAEWVNVEIALDGQVFTEAKNVKFQYYGEFLALAAFPAGGPKAGGTEITITGAGFFMSGIYLSCFFGDGNTECSVDVKYPCYKVSRASYVTPTRVTCMAPSMPPGGDVSLQYGIRVGLNGQNSQACPNMQTAFQCPILGGLAFTYYNDVFITGISPNAGQTMGKTTVTVYGSGFRPDLASRTRCMFTRCTASDVYTTGDRLGEFKNPSQRKCTGTTVVSPAAPGDVGVISTSLIQCIMPAASSSDTHFTLVDISLNSGISNQNFYGPTCIDDLSRNCKVLYFYYALPTLSLNRPSIGPEIGGTVVNVIGMGFLGSQNTLIRCKFGDAESPAVKFVTESTITCVAPKQPAATVRIQVSLNGMDVDFTPKEMGSVFVYHIPPVLLDRPEPSAGPTSGGTIITIKGTGFVNGGLSCKFWTTPAKSNLNKIVKAEFLTATAATCPSPPVTQAQLVSISLSLNGQDYSPSYLEDLFYYYPAPQVRQVYPSSGPAASGGYALVRGDGFIETRSLKCRVGVIETVAQYMNNTFVRCVTPQIQPKAYSAPVLALLSKGSVSPQVLPESFVSYPVQGYPLELSFDGQTFSNNGNIYTYYTTPLVDVVSPSSGPKSARTTIVVLSGAFFRNDLGGPFCRFGGVGATKAVFLTDRTMRCQLPAVDLGRTVIIELSINGQEFEEHASVPYTFFGLAPLLLSADLTENFDMILLKFSSNTNRANQAGIFPCENILSIQVEHLYLKDPNGAPLSGLSTAEVQALGNTPTASAMFTAVFGFGLVCRFQSNQTGALVMGASPKVGLGYPIVLKEGLFMQGVELSYFASGNATLRSPTAPRKPVALVSAVEEIGACEDLVINAAASTGGLGRALQYVWFLDPLKSAISDDTLRPNQKSEWMNWLARNISLFEGTEFDAEGRLGYCRNPTCLVPATNGTAAHYKNCYCNQIRVPFKDYPVGRYTVQLTVTNWQGAVSEPVYITVEKKLTNIPTVKIDTYVGDEDREIDVSQTVTLDGSSVASSCDGTSTTSKKLFRWQILDKHPLQNGAIISLSSPVFYVARTLFLPAYSLQPGKTYFVQLRVIERTGSCSLPPDYPAKCVDSDTLLCCLFGTDVTRLKTGRSEPVAKIRGTEMTASSLRETQIDGSGSYHPDFPGSSQPTLSYEWSCACTQITPISTIGCFSPEGIAFGSGNGKVLVVPANSFDSSGGVYYDFTLKVCYLTLCSITAIRINPTPEAVPLVRVMVQKTLPKYPPNKKLSLSSIVTPFDAPLESLKYAWSTVSGDLDLSRSQFLLSPATTPSLVVKPDVLTAGFVYTVSLTVTENDMKGFGLVTFQMDTPPTGGVFEVSPTTGTAMDTQFLIVARRWVVDSDTLPIRYAFEYKQEGTPAPSLRVLQNPSESGIVSKSLPPGPDATENVWLVQARIINNVESETLVTSCNMVASLCRIKVAPKVYASIDAMLTEIYAQTSTVQNYMDGGNPLAAINYLSLLLETLNANRRSQRRVVTATTDADIADIKCGTLAPLLYQSLPSAGLVGYPSADVVAGNVIASLVSLFAVTTQVTDQCLTQMTLIVNVVLIYMKRASTTIWETEPDTQLITDLADTVTSAMNVVRYLLTKGTISNTTTAARMTTLLSQYDDITAVRSFGLLPVEAAKKIGCERTAIPGCATALMTSLVWRLSTPTTAAKTQLPGWESSFTQSVFSLPANTLPFAISKVSPVISNNAIALSENASVSAVATHFLNFYNPYFFSSDADLVIAPVLSLQMQAFGISDADGKAEVVSLANLASPITIIFSLKSKPDATKDADGRYRVASCAYWDATKWQTKGCTLDGVSVAQSGGQSFKATCKCSTVGQHTVLNLQAGCDGIAFSTQKNDVCGVCGGDGVSCKGCDGVPNSGLKYDGCTSTENLKGICGGDNSSCAGCDGLPKSGTVLDQCSVCGGDNSTCMGCDGIAVHPMVTARTGLQPKAFDKCISSLNPFGVCGGCDASCIGCDNKVKSGKRFDKCGRCGPFSNAQDAAKSGVAPDDYYSQVNKDNCTAGLKVCPNGFEPDDCSTCVLPGAKERNQDCKGCGNDAGMFSCRPTATRPIQCRKVAGGTAVDRCGVCGGNDCSCIDCKGVVGGKAQYDRCGICEGNSTCLDCMGTPYGVKTRDVCGICGGNNDTKNCRGCDGRLYPLPLMPAQFDRNFQCCQVKEIGCNNTCYATLGCDGVCSNASKVLDRCGVCGGANAPNTGVCDCNSIRNGPSRIGCDGKCRNPPLVYDICGICGGNNASETGHCDCEGMPHGPAIRDSSGVCCYMSDMGCGSKNQSRCFSGKTWDICNTCGGDGGTCVQTRPSSASSLSDTRTTQRTTGYCLGMRHWHVIVLALLLALLSAVHRD